MCALRRVAVILFALCVTSTCVLSAEPSSPVTNESARDALGDPLPAGAVRRLGTKRFRHSQAIWSLAFSPNGKILAAGGVDGSVRLWDAASGKELARDAIGTSLLNVTFSPNSTRLAIAADSGLWVWDWKQKQQAHRFARPLTRKSADGTNEFAIGLFHASFSSDGTSLACADEAGTVRRWELTTKGERPPAPSTWRLPLTLDRLSGIAFAADNKLIAFNRIASEVSLWNLDGGK